MSATLELLKKGKSAPPSVDDEIEDGEEAEEENEALAEEASEKQLDADEGATQSFPTADELSKLKKDGLMEVYEQYVLAESQDIANFEKLSLAKKRAALLKYFETVSSDLDEAVAATPEPAKKKKSAKKGQEIIGPDPISKAAHEIENISSAEDAVKKLHDLDETNAFNDFQIGGLLSKIQTEAWIGEYENFRSFCEGEFGIKYRKAMYLISIYDGLVEANIPWDAVKEVGWTKLKELVPVLTEENVAEWAEKATLMNTDQLMLEVKEALKGESQASEKEASDTKVSSLTFKVHDDQKESITEAIAKAMEMAQTDVKSVALEYACLEFLSGAGKNAKAKPKGFTDPGALLKHLVETKGHDAALKMAEKAMVEAFPEDFEEDDED